MDNYFTLGQDHTHRINGFTYDCDVVIKITAETEEICRQKMFDTFGPRWAFQYTECPDLLHFPRGIKELDV